MRNNQKPTRLVSILAFAAAFLFLSSALFAQVVIPAGSTIDGAELSVFADEYTGQTVYLYRITVDWGELTVTWNSFDGSYDPTVIGSFVSTYGWNTVDVTALVEGWVAGTAPNHGILLAEPGSYYSRYFSSEYDGVPDRPRLEIWYTDPTGQTGHVVIQRPGVETDGVKDAHIMESSPNHNGFYIERLFTGFLNGFEKQSLVQFLFDVESSNPGTGTPGYWKNHANAWPVGSITIGGVSYAKNDAIRIMKRPVRRDMRIAMFKALVATKLNVMIGNDPSCISQEIIDADAWMAANAGDPVRANSAAWDIGEPIFRLLNHYNNGRLPCADHRD
jgi:hypothetical protein